MIYASRVIYRRSRYDILPAAILRSKPLRGLNELRAAGKPAFTLPHGCGTQRSRVINHPCVFARTGNARPRIDADGLRFCHPERSGRSPRSRRILKTSYPFQRNDEDKSKRLLFKKTYPSVSACSLFLIQQRYFQDPSTPLRSAQDENVAADGRGFLVGVASSE